MRSLDLRLTSEPPHVIDLDDAVVEGEVNRLSGVKLVERRLERWLCEQRQRDAGHGDQAAIDQQIAYLRRSNHPALVVSQCWRVQNTARVQTAGDRSSQPLVTVGRQQH